MSNGIGQNNMDQFKNFLNPGTETTAEPPKEEISAPAVETPTEPNDPTPEPIPAQEPSAEQVPEGPQTNNGPAPEEIEDPQAQVVDDPQEPESPEAHNDQNPELNDDLVLGYFKEKYGREFSSLEEMFQPAEQPVIDPFAGVSDEVVQFKKFNEETGRGFDDFMKLNQDVDKLNPIQLARDKVSSILPNVSDKQVDEYLEQKLNIDVSNPKEMSVNDRIELETFVKDYREQLKTDQEKYKQPIERPQVPSNEVEMVELENGMKMPKQDYDNFLNNRNQYINDIKKATDKITSSVYDIKIDENGSEKTLKLGYDYSKEDKHGMASSALDATAALESMFTNDKGEVDHVGLQEAMFWANPQNRTKAIVSIVHKSRADQAKEFLKSRSNANFRQPSLPGDKPVTKTVPIPGTENHTGIKHDFSQFYKRN
ncbi:hypothetical protein [Flagellimonas nanhaiensis]|uniref:Uncharacterized protein n=1 Tax=Flagellimonas nanhaiensis TaxID=2292706 RepID=A0A371JKU8_9FLAO|nr:hypothetical protein [Allomuricauda nanhaiensis]RDY57572.1 hypothetical protein DX873_18615 [Allomuricauda nanhaiensis]